MTAMLDVEAQPQSSKPYVHITVIADVESRKLRKQIFILTT